jgi:hypothetical protein
MNVLRHAVVQPGTTDDGCPRRIVRLRGDLSGIVRLLPNNAKTVVAGAGSVADWTREKVPLLSVEWIYAIAKQGAREMRRVGLTL